MEQIRHSSDTDEAKTLRQRVDIDCLDENKGGTEFFKLHLDRMIANMDEIKNVLVEYFNLDPSIIKNSKVSIKWGIVKDRSKAIAIDKLGQEFRYTFAPDIVIEDEHKKIIAVIQLKGRSQNRSEITATMSFFQMVELFKYHVEHEVPVALVNINKAGNGVQYEWLVLGKANTPLFPFMKQLIDPITGVDPILPRNARSRKFARTVYDKLNTMGSEFLLNDLVSKFQNTVNKSQLKFQKLRFHKEKPKFLDVEIYWDRIIEKYNVKFKKEIHPMGFDEFYAKWKKMIVLDYGEQLKEIKFDEE